MKVKLIPITQKKKPKNRFIIYVDFMSGDADHYETEKYFCKDEQEFKTMMCAIKEGIANFRHNYEREEQASYWYKIFGEKMEIPYDVTCESYPARLTSVKGFYYDEDGVKFVAELSL